MAKTLLEQLNTMTVTVADTGDIHSIEQWRPRDATTNPSLITAAAQMPEYRDIVDGALRWAEQKAGGAESKRIVGLAVDRLAVEFGLRILGIVPGRVSTEVDARLSFDTEATIAKGRYLIEQYEAAGASRERVLIKIASTWEGIRAAEVLQKEGIHCNLTLLFGLHQAVACAEAGGDADLALRGPDPRLVQEADGPRELPAGGGSGRPQRGAHLRLLQEVRLPDGGDGGELPQHRRDRRARGLRPAHHRARTCSPS